MNESIRKFLSNNVSSKMTDDFSVNTTEVKNFIAEMAKVEDLIKNLDITNEAQCAKVVDKYNKLKEKYSSISHLLERNQEIIGRYRKIEKDLASVNEVKDFGARIAEFKKRLINLIEIDAFLSEYERIKSFYEENHDTLSKNETIITVFEYVTEMVNYIKSNIDYLKSFVEDAKRLVINDENYMEIYEKFNAYKEKLESIYDELYLDLVNEVVMIVSTYPTGLESSQNLVNKIEFLSNRIDEDDWSRTDYLDNLKSQITTFQEEYNVINLNSKPFIRSETYNKCRELINALTNKVTEVGRVIDSYTRFKNEYKAIRRETDATEMAKKRDKFKSKFAEFTYKDRFPAFKAQVENLDHKIDSLIQNNIVKAINALRRTISADLSVSTLKSKRDTLKSLYVQLDHEHKPLVEYDAILRHINNLIRGRKIKDLHSKKEFWYIFVAILSAGLLFGYVMYCKFVGTEPLKWLFNNPPYFGHKWAHWGLIPWKWVTSYKAHDLVSFIFLVLIFIASVICMLFCLIGEVLWFLITLIAYALSWLVLTLLSIIIHVLMYIFPVVAMFVGILITINIYKKNHIRSPLFMILTILVICALGVIAFLFRFEVFYW